MAGTIYYRQTVGLSSEVLSPVLGTTTLVAFRTPGTVTLETMASVLDGGCFGVLWLHFC